ncbi:hypothetical protein [Teichococcus aestuarii]|uniref:hypothetical protein n=1 Tax=Teichococcus aestuarii TaxID=568898 RepID=UPI00361DC0D0
MSLPERHARLELDAPLRRPLPRPDAEALVALVMGRLPARPPAHPLFSMPEAGTILTGESLDHLTQGSRILQDEDGPRLCVSASLPPWPGLLEASVDWLGGQLRLALGEVAGFTVPAHSHRHDMRLLIWTGTRLCPLGPLPDQRAGALAGGCSMAAFQRAAGLPAPDEPESVLRPIMRRVALAQLRRQALPVSQALLDGPFEGQVLFRLWLAAAAEASQGFTTATVPLALHVA